jgi:hypothetical protein
MLVVHKKKIAMLVVSGFPYIVNCCIVLKYINLFAGFGSWISRSY